MKMNFVNKKHNIFSKMVSQDAFRMRHDFIGYLSIWF